MKLIKLLKSLTQDEFKELKLFLQSPFYNTDMNLVRLHVILSRCYPITDPGQFNKKKLFAQVFPGHNWNDGKWRNLTSKMVKALEQFLVVQELKGDDNLDSRNLLVRAYGRRNLYPLFEKDAKAFWEDLNERSITDQSALLTKMQIGQLLYYHPLSNKLGTLSYLVSAKKDASEFFQGQQLKLSCEELVYGHKLNHKRELKEASAPSNISYRLYKLVHDVLEDQTDTSFQTAKSYFDSVVDQLLIGDKKFALLHLINFAIQKLNLSQKDYRIVIFELYKQGLEQDILIENGLLSEFTFNNIIAISAAFGEYKWAEDFIEKYQAFLPSKNREDSKTMGLANLYFQQKNYSRIIDLLGAYNTEDVTYLLVAKTMLLRSYFEFFLQDHSYYEMMLNYSLSFESLVKRKKSLQEERKIGCLHLSTFIRKISNAILGNNWNSQTKNNYLKTVKLTNPLIGKQWLIEKIDSM